MHDMYENYCSRNCICREFISFNTSITFAANLGSPLVVTIIFKYYCGAFQLAFVHCEYGVLPTCPLIIACSSLYCLP